MKCLLHISLMLLLPMSAMAQGKSGKNTWDDTRTMQLVGSPNVQLTVRASGFSSDSAEDSDDSTTLMWSQGSSRSKITVSTFSPSQKFDLFVEAEGVDNAKSAGRIQLVDGMPDTNLIVNVKKNKSGSARIVYTARADISNGNTDSDFNDVHTITYTVTDM